MTIRTPQFLSSVVIAVAMVGSMGAMCAGEASATAPTSQTQRLDEFFDGEVGWPLNLGTEFPGAQGTLVGVPDQPRAGMTAVQLSGDFTKGGAYISTGCELPAGLATVAIRFQVQTSNVERFSIRVIDATGQCHQAKGPALIADGAWHEVEILPTKVAGGEHWGGANDGTWHGPGKAFHLVIGPNEKTKQPVLRIGDIRAEMQSAAAAQGASWMQDFEAAAPTGWNMAGDTALDASIAFKGKASLRLLWDDGFLYVSARVTDDVFANTKQGGDLWAGEGVQFLIDPCRESAEKIGKYDLGMALTPAGPQTWCFGSADASAPGGEVTTVKLAVKPTGVAGGMIYEMAIPWARIAPFKPAVGRDLGLSMIINEDDGKGRDGFIGWMSGVHLKEVDMVGDLILLGD